MLDSSAPGLAKTQDLGSFLVPNDDGPKFGVLETEPHEDYDSLAGFTLRTKRETKERVLRNISPIDQ